MTTPQGVSCLEIEGLKLSLGDWQFWQSSVKSTVHLIFQQGEINTSGKKKSVSSNGLGPMNQREQNVFHLGRGVVAPMGGFRLLSIIRVKLGHGVHRGRKMRQLELVSPSLPSPWSLCTNSTMFFIRFRFHTSQVALVVKNLPANSGDTRDAGSIPGSGRSPGGGHGNPLQYSCLESPMDRWSLAGYGGKESDMTEASQQEQRQRVKSLHHLEFLFLTSDILSSSQGNISSLKSFHYRKLCWCSFWIIA